jgi:phage gp36-like protein
VAYLTQEDLAGELGARLLIQLTDDDGTDTVNDGVVSKAIAYAEGVFDSYARTRYSVPVPITPLVVALNKDIAIFHLYKRRVTVTKDGVYEVRKQTFDDAIALLKAISSGKAALDVPALEETMETPATGDHILSGRKRRHFTDEKLSGF